MNRNDEKTKTYSLLKACFWKALTDLAKRPAPMRRMKLVMTTRKMVRASEKVDIVRC